MTLLITQKGHTCIPMDNVAVITIGDYGDIWVCLRQGNMEILGEYGTRENANVVFGEMVSTIAAERAVFRFPREDG